MITLTFHFPWRRYHATPWGRLVNEGAVEVPPSPWRILRTLYAVWKQRLPDHPDTEVLPILDELAAAPPYYFVPPHELAHSRHYFPDSNHGTDKAVDAFAVLGGDATIHVQWAATLTADQSSVLGRLAQSVPYLGRADSLVEAALLDEPCTPPTTHTAYQPHDPALDFDSGFGPDIGGPSGPGRVQLLAPGRPLNLDGLLMRPVEVRSMGFVYPPGSRHLTYTAVPPPTADDDGSAPSGRDRARRPNRGTRRQRPSRPVTAVRLAVAGRPRPPVTQALPLADAFRAGCIDVLTTADSGFRNRFSNIAGRDGEGKPLRGQHQHAHFLPYDADGDHRIDDLLVWAPGGITDEELDGIGTLARGRTVGVPDGVPGPRNQHLRITAAGPAELVLPDAVRRASTTWTSVTPFVPARRLARGRSLLDALTAEVRRELGYRRLPPPDTVELVPGSWNRHTRHRWTKRETLLHARPGHGLRLTFPEPVAGPLALGHHSHFGLGLFLPSSPASEPQVRTETPGRTEGKCRN